MLVINSIEKTRLSADSYSYSGTGVAWKARLVLFLGFALMAGGLAGSVVSLSPWSYRALQRKRIEGMEIIERVVRWGVEDWVADELVGCTGAEVYCTKLPLPNTLLWCCERHHEWIDHAKVMRSKYVAP